MMKHLNKYLSLALALVLCLSLAACGESNEDYGRVRSAEGLSPHRGLSPRSDMAALPQQGAAPLAPLRG